MPKPKRFLFFGGGPCPLTSFCISDMLADPEVEIVNVDRSLSATRQATALAAKEGYTALRFRSGDANNVDETDASLMDVVYLAALVGESGQEKRELLERIVRKMRVGGVLVIRTAWGLRRMLYPVGLSGSMTS